MEQTRNKLQTTIAPRDGGGSTREIDDYVSNGAEPYSEKLRWGYLTYKHNKELLEHFISYVNTSNLKHELKTKVLGNHSSNDYWRESTHVECCKLVEDFLKTI